MKTLLLITSTLSFSACNLQSNKKTNSNNTEIDTLLKRDTVHVYQKSNERDWQEGFGLTHDPDKDSIWYKPSSYYLSDKECSGLASDFYYGRLRPSDNGVTDELLKLATTDNKKLRPFYRWCLNKTIVIEDGALAEHTDVPARKYAEKFPNEFFNYVDIDTSGEKLKDWVGSISYSGFYDQDDYERPNEIQQRMAKTMKSNCKDCNDQIIRRIDKFTKDCFKQITTTANNGFGTMAAQTMG